MTGPEAVAGDHPPAFLDARAVLRRHGLRPDRRLGQNFLIDPGALERVVEAAELDPQDTVLEIGAGIGTLTARLAREGRRIVAVELDRRLIEPLLEGVQRFPGVQVVQADVLKLDLAVLMQGNPFRVVANIPYQITSHLLRRLMQMQDGPDRVVLTLQAEVVDRVIAGAGEMSLLALSVQVYGRARRVAHIPAGAFFPVPEVDSAVLRIDRHLRPAVAPELIPAFFRVARAGFQQRRKQLHNALSAGLGLGSDEIAAMLERAGVRPDVRAQDLALADWERLARQLG